jgi:hypothetical protein
MAVNEVVIDVRTDTAKAKKGLEGISQTAKKVGLGLTAMGAVGVVAIKSFVTAALEQEKAMKTLAATVEATGTNFDTVREQIEATTQALQDKTNFGDEQQIRALSQLIPIFGNVNDALAALPVLLDASASSGKSLETVVSTMGRALSGATNTSIILGVTFDKTATFAERLAIAQGKVGGAAEANVDPMIQLSNTMGDFKEVIGAQLLPVIIPLIAGFGDIIERVSTINPILLKVGVLALAGAVGFAAIAGPILLFVGFLPALITGFAALGPAIAIATGPIGLIVLAIAGLIAAGLLIIKNWDKIKEAATVTWTAIKDSFQTVFETLPTILKGVINVIIGQFNALIKMWNDLTFGIPPITALGKTIFPGINVSTPNIPLIPSLAHGGIVTRPTLAVVGEAGPEAIIPLGGNADGNNGLAAAIKEALSEIRFVIDIDGRELAVVQGTDAFNEEQVRSR